MSGRVSGRKKSRASIVPPLSPPPPPLPPVRSSPQRATGGGGGNRFSGIPAAVVGVIGEFGDRPSRIAASRTSTKLAATLEARCPVRACLAAEVRDSCGGVCEQRGARLIQQAVAEDPGVLDEFTFVSSEYPNEKTTAAPPGGGDDDDDGAGHWRYVEFTSRPLSTADPAYASLRRLELTFRWDTDDVHRANEAESKSSGDAHLGALYLADGKEARDVLALIERLRIDRRGGGGGDRSSPNDLTDLTEIYEAYRKPTTVGEITQRLEQTRLETNVDEADLEEAERLRSDALRETYRRVTGRRLAALPSLAPIPFAVAWVTRAIASLFRDGSAAGWSIESADLDRDNVRDSIMLHATAPLADVGPLFLRLLSEPPGTFDRVVLAPVAGVIRGAPARTRRAEKMLREGIRVWRGADLVSGKFAVDDPEFHRLYPEVRRLAAAATAAAAAARAAAKGSKNGEDEGEQQEEEEEEEEPRESKEEKRAGPSPPRSPTGARGRPETRDERRQREAAEFEAETDVRRYRAPRGRGDR